MADYSEIGTIIGQMKRAAIDSFMGGQGWIPNYAADDLYSLWGVFDTSYSRPAADTGEGGGIATAYADDMVETFDNIRARIDSATRKWTDLPAGDGVAGTLENLNVAAGLLGASAGGAARIVDFEIDSSLSTVEYMCTSNMRGSFLDPFLDKYTAQSSIVVCSTGAAIAILQTAFSAEKDLWPVVRQDAVDICQSVSTAFAVNAKQSSDAVGKVVLRVVTLIAGAVTLIATAGTASPAVLLAGYAVLAADSVKGFGEDLPVPTDSYESIISALESSLENLNEVITLQEEAIDVMMTKTLSYIDESMESFNLDAYRLKPFSPDDTMALASDQASVVLSNMDRIVADLASTTTALGSDPSDGFLRRHGAIGMGAAGPFDRLVELHDVLFTCVKATRDEYQNGRDLFDLAVKDYASAEAEAAAISVALNRELDGAIE
jgi:hypothetical protein